MAMFATDYVGNLEDIEKFTRDLAVFRRAVKVEYIRSLHIKTISMIR